MRTSNRVTALVVVALLPIALAQLSVLQGVVPESDAPTPQVTTEELERIVADGSALLLDSRSFPEWAVGHLPGAVVLAPKPDQPPSQYVSDIAEVERLTNGDKGAAIVLYCNGPHCGKSKRLSGELAAAGYTSVRRYQLGAPVWRALGHPVVIEPAGVQYVLEDATAYWVDARDPAEVAVVGSLAGVRNLANVPSGTVNAAKDERRLPMHDYNTRVVVFGADGAQARQVAEELTAGAFHNVAYFDGSFEGLTAAASAAPAPIEVVQRFYDALAAGDVPTILELLAPDVAWIEPEGVPFAGVYLGPDALLEKVLARIGAEWEEFGVVPDEFIGAGERVTVLGTLSGLNVATGKALRTPYVAVWTVQGGKVTRYQSFVNTAAFVEAAAAESGRVEAEQGIEAGLRELEARWQEAQNLGDPEAVAELFTEDGWFSPFDGTTVEGREALRAFFGEAGGLRIEISPKEHVAAGEVAHGYGTYMLWAPDGAQIAGGNYLGAYRRIDGEWLIHRYIGNAAVSDEPQDTLTLGRTATF